MRIIVNGHAHDIDAGGDVPLLSILRNDLGLTAAKYGCGIGKCGACTVLVGGRARRHRRLGLWPCPVRRAERSG